jgi:2,4-dienoyl-CoA reductase-like NADH-dependent reductase (Old Yellow Enzyme family)
MRIIDNENHLKISYEIRDMDVASRFFFAPINTGLAEYGAPTKDLISFHSERSGKNIGINYVGNVAIGKNFLTNDKTLYFTQSTLNSWKKLSEAISDKGTLPGIQIACRIAKSPSSKLWINKDIPSYIKSKYSGLGKGDE